MDRRTLLALLLTAIVIVATPFIFPPPSRVGDTTVVMPGDTVTSGVAPPTAIEQTTIRSAPAAPLPGPLPAMLAADTTLVRTDRATYRIVSPGGTPASVTLTDYRSLRPGSPPETALNMLEPGDRLFRLRFVTRRDTIALDTVAFRAGAQARDGNAVVQTFTSASMRTPVTLTYRIPADSFIVHVSGTVGTPASGGDDPWRLLVHLPWRIRTEEANAEEDTRSLAVSYRKRVGEVESAWFRDLDSLVARVDTGSIRWVTERNKYFLVAVIPTAPDTTFQAVSMLAGPRTGKDATVANTVALLPLRDGTFGLSVYAGPQSWEHMRATVADLENVNPYGGWLHGMVQPFATIVMRMLLWMRHTFAVSYGWVLVIFGVVVRLMLWPLNQNAMRSSLKMQRIQPQLAELQKKHRDNPEKQREAMLKLYQEYGMSPFTPVLGCLPMLLPMPILFALYFVFQNTIEFRGVPFMWLPDLSLKDPYFITPLFMGLSMFLLSWIGMRGVPPTPQTKMMAYVMPVMFTALFWNFASGLNLYYAVQNVAALPQQWLLSRERVASKATTPPSPPPPNAVAAKPSQPPRKKK
ncbi:MAG: YidC/Oxa1 family insertase periplasmic-domain containing protein [Gemmatimonadaceae bacterium]